MKVDVEGHECEAIGGSKNILGKKNEQYFISINDISGNNAN